MNKLKYTLFLIGLVIAFSCQNQVRLKADLLRLQNSLIVIPQGMQVTCSGINTTITDIQESTLKMVVYTDSTGCSSCGINKMYLWEPLLDYSKTFEGRLKFYFIFHPAKDGIDILYTILKNNQLDYPVLIDSKGDFEKLNPHLPKNKALHTFLLDENNKVILVGNPLYSKEIEKLFYKITQEKLGK